MYQSVSQRFRRKNSNDLIVTFLPVVVVLTLHSYLRTAGLNPTLFRVLQIMAIVLLAALLAAVNHFYFRSFCYTLIDGSVSRPREALRFPDDSLTFERVQNKKSRIYERVCRQEMLCLLEPGETYNVNRFGPVSRTFLMTARSAKSAARLYYKQDGTVYCAKFHPDAEQTDLIRRWIGENTTHS